MGKIVLSGSEFNQLCDYFQGKESNQFRWMEFSDSIDQVFTKKHLERGLDVVLDDVRTQSFYGFSAPSETDLATVEQVKRDFMECVTRERLDAKSFFQDFDRHHHFKITPTKFKQILTLLKVPIVDAGVKAIVKVYGNKQGDIEYLRFLNDTACLVYTINEPATGSKTTYTAQGVDHSGIKQIDALMNKIKEHVKRYRIRLGEFF